MIYNFDEVKQSADCFDVAVNMLGLKPVKGNRFNCPWRLNSDSEAFEIRKDSWSDYVEEKHGSVIDLVMNIKKIDHIQATTELGKYLNLQPIPMEKSDAKAPKPKRKIDKVYNYTDENGKTIFEVVRMLPKSFYQRRPATPEEIEINKAMHPIEDVPLLKASGEPYKVGKGGYINTIKGVTKVPYLLPKWNEQKYVIFVEGEKDADLIASLNLPVTSFAGGSNEWEDYYLKYFLEKKVYLFHDNDTAGYKHAINVAEKLFNAGCQVKLTKVSSKPKGDINDLLQDFNDMSDKRSEVINIIKKAEWLTKEDFNHDDDINKAKSLNVGPVKNYVKRGKVFLGRNIKDIADELYARLLGYPKLLGGQLFDLDRDTGKVRFIRKVSDLTSWIANKTGYNMDWKRGDTMTTKEELLSYLYANSDEYYSISETPHHPMQERVFYHHPELPPPTKEHKYFEEFCQFFCPATEWDGYLIKAFVASGILANGSYRPPCFIIDAVSGQGTGKTQLVEKVALLWGGRDEGSQIPLTFAPSILRQQNPSEKIIRQILSGEGRRKKYLLIDNVSTTLNSDVLAGLVTLNTISGMAPFGKDTESRVNDIIYCVTMNNAKVDRDMADRSLIIKLEKPEKRDSFWDIKVRRYIKDNKYSIIADIIDILKSKPATYHSFTRFPAWESEVMNKIIDADARDYQSVVNEVTIRKKDADHDSRIGEDLHDFFYRQIRNCAPGNDPEQDCYFITSNLMRHWYSKLTGDRPSYSVNRKINTLISMGVIDGFNDAPDVDQKRQGGSRYRGRFWNYSTVGAVKGYILDAVEDDKGLLKEIIHIKMS